MEAIGDFSWVKQVLTAEVIERFQVGDFRAIALRIPQTEGNALSQHRFRILLFHAGDAKPSVALNLETSILGSLCLTEQVGREHRNLGTADDALSYADFRTWALGRVQMAVTHTAEQRSDRGRPLAVPGKTRRPRRPAPQKRSQG